MSQRQTRQRSAIQNAIEDAPGPVGVRQLLEEAQKVLPGLGIATVYRTVKLLQEQGEIHPVQIDGETLYESARLGHHHHFSCRVCGQVYDLNHCPLKLSGNEPALRGYQIESHQVTLYGVCSGCSQHD